MIGSPGLRSGLRCVLELLSRDRRLVHRATLDDGERRHALVVLAGRGSILLSTAGAGTGPARAGTGTCRGGDGDGARIGAEFEAAAGELVERALILEENDLAEALATGLEADADLCHGHIAHVLAMFVYAAGAVRTADDEAPLADAGKHRVAVGLVEELPAGPGILEHLYGVAVVIGPARSGAQQQEGGGHRRNTALHHRYPPQTLRLPTASDGAFGLITINRICAGADSRQAEAARAVAPAAAQAAAAPSRTRRPAA